MSPIPFTWRPFSCGTPRYTSATLPERMQLFPRATLPDENDVKLAYAGGLLRRPTRSGTKT
eukprot:1181622-Prorocentrum_minimum.AAC.1